MRRVLIIGCCGVAISALGVWRVADLAGAAVSPKVAAAQPFARHATVVGYVQLCGGAYPGGCWVSTLNTCGPPPDGCVKSDQVVALSKTGRSLARQRLYRAHFRLKLPLGRYTIELLADGKGVRGRVMQRKAAIVKAHRTAVVRFVFFVP